VNDSTGTVINRWYTSSQVNASSGECSITPSEVISGNATWWVRAWNSQFGNGAWSDGMPFEVGGGPPSPPTLFSPSGTTADSTPLYRWSVVPGATWYQLWVNDSTGTVINRWYTSSQVNASSDECSITPSEAIASGDAMWWVRAWSQATGNGAWSSRGDFSVCTAGFETAWTQSAWLGGVYLVNVTASSQDCEWSLSNAASLPAWITVVDGAGVGDGQITIDIAENLFESRQAVLTIGDQEHLISQVGPGAFVGWHFEKYPVEVAGTEYRVIDVFAEFDESDAVVLNVFDSNIENNGMTPFHHNDISTLNQLPGTWLVQQSLNLPEAGITPQNDSFVLIGGPIGSANNTVLDPSFNPATAPVPPANAGWFTGNPPALQGKVDPLTRRTFVARFVIESGSGEVLDWSANLGYFVEAGLVEYGFDTLLLAPVFSVPYE
jgi:hypothetical protein